MKCLLKVTKLLSSGDGIRVRNLVVLALDFKAGLFALTVLGHFEGGTEFQQVKDTRRGFIAEETAQARCGDGVWNVFVVMGF